MSDLLSVADSGATLSVSLGEIAIADYSYRVHAPESEAPKPFMHPLRSTSGAPLSVARPWDHRWHKGLQMTWSHVSGDNFWGGPTFSREGGYEWKSNLGRMEHEAFISPPASGESVDVRERLSWISSSGERWVEEQRHHRFHSADVRRGVWALDFGTELVNVSGRSLEFGSPSTHGREAAGYAGWFWRGPRSWTGADVLTSTGLTASDAMGSVAEWIAVRGENDEIDGGATLLAFAGTSNQVHPIRWFVRSEPFAALNPAPAFSDEIVLETGATLSLQHRFVFIDSVATDDRLAAFAEEFAL